MGRRAPDLLRPPSTRTRELPPPASVNLSPGYSLRPYCDDPLVSSFCPTPVQRPRIKAWLILMPIPQFPHLYNRAFVWQYARHRRRKEKPFVEARGGSDCMELRDGPKEALGLELQQDRAHSLDGWPLWGTQTTEKLNLGAQFFSLFSYLHSLSSRLSSRDPIKCCLFTDDSQVFPPARTFSPLFSRHEDPTQHLHLDV